MNTNIVFKIIILSCIAKYIIKFFFFTNNYKHVLTRSTCIAEKKNVYY